MLEIFQDFAVARAQVETILKCWSLQQNAGDLGNYVDSIPVLLNSFYV